MAEKTFEDGVIEGRIAALEQTSANNVTANEGLRKDLTDMGESIRKGFIVAISDLKDDIKEDIRVQIAPVISELRGNGQPGLVKRFERYVMMAKLNWVVTMAMFGAIVALKIWF